MKKQGIAVMVAAFATLICFSSCGEDKSGSDEGPVLSLSSVEGKPGETVNVTFSVSGADEKWSSCGIHILYDEALTCVASENASTSPDCITGAAVADMTATISLLWIEDRIDELIENKKYSVFFAAVGEGDVGRDGDIVEYKFIIPENAEPGTVYDIEFFIREGDMFTNAASDEEFQEYAFSNWENGSITVI